MHLVIMESEIRLFSLFHLFLLATAISSISHFLLIRRWRDQKGEEAQRKIRALEQRRNVLIALSVCAAIAAGIANV